MAKKTTNTKSGNAAKKRVAAGKSGEKDDGADAEREALARELRSLIPQLDSQGLAFLVEQARIHIYNLQVEELNKASAAADAAAERTASLAGKAGSSREKSKTAGENFRIDGTESGSSYYLHYRNDEAMFSRDEMIHLVKIVNAKGTDLEIRERLYRWFDRERRDVFAVVPIKGKHDIMLKSLAAQIKNSFKLHGG